MYDIQINCESRYKVNRKFIVGLLEKVLTEEQIRNPVSVSLLICGKRKIRELSRRYLKAAEDHDVLSFAFSEVNKQFMEFPDGFLRLGEIAVCYPLAQEQAMEENTLVDEAVGDLARHGLYHLLGQNHEEEEYK